MKRGFGFGIAALLLLGATLLPMSTSAEDCDAACQAARNAQDPLADMRAVMTDNTIAFGTSPRDATSYGFQIQPVYSIPTDRGFNLIARGIIPLAGVEQGAGLPAFGPDPIGGSGNTFGLGDVLAQGFFVPQLEDSPIKFGFGPQVSLRTRSEPWAARAGAVAWSGSLTASQAISPRAASPGTIGDRTVSA